MAGSKQLPDHEQEGLQRAVLLACKGQALSINEILAAPAVAAYVERYGEEPVKRFIRALAKTSLLFQSHQTSAAVYRSTRDAQRLLDED